MRDNTEVKEQLIKEVAELRQRITELERAETERRQTEKLLRNERDIFFSLFEKAPYGVMLLDRDGKVLFVNTEFTTITGYSLEDIPTTQEWIRLAYSAAKKSDVLGADTSLKRNQAQRQTNGVFRKMVHRVFFRTFSVVCKDRSIKEVEFRPVMLSDGSTIVMLNDITERRRAEEALQGAYDGLKKSEERYRTLVDNIALGINLIDSNYNLLMVNAAQSKDLNKPVSELIGKKCFREFAKRDAVCPRCPGVQAMSTGQPAVVEVKGVRDDGSRYNARVQAFPVFGQDGQTTGFIEVAEDITERKQEEEELARYRENLESLVKERTAGLQGANKQLQREMIEHVQTEDALRESEERFRLLVEHSKDIFMLHEYGRIIDVNQHACECLGYTREELLNLSLQDIDQDVIPGRHRQKWEQMVPGVPVTLEGILRRKDGTTFPVEIRLVAFESHGRRLMLGLARDITERRRAEEALRGSEERYRSLVENIGLGVNLIDADHHIVMTNISQGKHFSKPASEMIGQKCFREFEKRDTVCPHCPGVQTIATGQPAEAETVVVRDDGSRYDVRIQTFPTFDGDGTVTGFIEIAENITKRKRAEAELTRYREDLEGLVKERTKELRENEERFRLLVDNLKDGLILHDFDGRIIDASQHACENMGYTRKEMLGLSIQDIDDNFIPGKYKEKWEQMVPGVPITIEGVQRRKDGTTFPVEVRLGVFESGGRRFILGVGRDITDRKRAEEVLRSSEEKYRSLVEFTEDPVYLIDRDKRYLFMNGKYLSRLGLPRDQVIGSHYGDFHSREENKEFSGYIEQVFATGRFVQHEHRSRRDGRYFLRTLSPVKAPDGSIEAVTVISKDITERKRAEEELTYMVTHDPLTGLPNRMLFNDRLTLALAQAQRHKTELVVMLLDLDYFKNVNDTFGHNVGDQLLRAVGNRLGGLLRRGDTVARVGGDEFLVLLSEIVRITDADTVTRNILEAFRKPFVLDDHELKITTSIGIVIYPHDGDDADTLMKHADIAMYRAKDKGRNTYQRYAPQLE